MYGFEIRGKRILHCPDNLGNNARRLAEIERSKGSRSWSISLTESAYGFKADQTLSQTGSFWKSELARWRLLWIALTQYEIIHFNNGKTIMPHRLPFQSVKSRSNFLLACFYSIYSFFLEGKDLWLLKLFNKKIFFTYQGSDARLSSHYAKFHPPEVLEHLNPDYLSTTADAFKLKRIKRAKRVAEKIFCLNPDLLKNLLPNAEFIPYFNVDIKKIEPHSILQDQQIHIVHAPSKKDVKGTKYIEQAIATIKLKYDIKFTLVSGVSNQEAQKIYDTADIFIDQLIVGWYGGVAVELMARGVPTLCFLDNDSKSHVGKFFLGDLPIIETNINSIKKDVIDVITRPESELKGIGFLSREFVQKYHY